MYKRFFRNLQMRLPTADLLVMNSSSSNFEQPWILSTEVYTRAATEI